MAVPAYFAEQHASSVAAAIDDGAPADVFLILDGLTDEERMAVFRVYCTHCGAADSRCTCMACC